MKKHRQPNICLVSAFLIPFFFISVQAQFPSQNRSSISGFVFDQERRSIPQIPVELLNEVNSVIGRTRTDNSGRFFFTGLSQGRFSIKVLPFGTNYEEQTQDVEISGIGAFGRSIADNVQKDIYLRQRKNNNGISSITGTIFAQEIPVNAQKSFEKAILDLENNRLETGIEELKNAINLFPDYYLALERLGLTYVGQQKYQNAVEVFNKAVIINPRSFNSWYGLSYANYYLKQSKDAINAAEKAVLLNSNSVEAFIFLGISLRQDTQYEKAEKSLKQADKIAKGTSPEVHWNLALLYAHNLKRYKDAADELELYLKVSPDISNKDQIKKLISQFKMNAQSK